MSDWAQPFVDAGWSFDDRDQQVISPGDWRIALGVVIDDEGRWHVRLATMDGAGEHRRDYGFKKFRLVAADAPTYARFVVLLVDHARGLTKRGRTAFIRQLAGLINDAGATMVWFKSPEKKVVL